MKTKHEPTPEMLTGSNDLAVFNVPQKQDMEAFKGVTKSGTWLPRVQLFGGNSKVVKAQKFPLAHYGLVVDSNSIQDLGETFDHVPIAWRSKAMRIDGDDILSFYKQEDKEFQRIVEESDIQDSGCFFGPEYLIWLPKQQRFATMFWNSKTMRREAKNNYHALLGKPVTLTAHLIETKKYSWHGPQAKESTTPVTAVPSADEIAAEVERFNNPPANEVEKAETETSRER